MTYTPKEQTEDWHKTCAAKLGNKQYAWVVECAREHGLKPSDVISSLIDDQIKRDELEEGS